jgi:hypothetical protein
MSVTSSQTVASVAPPNLRGARDGVRRTLASPWLWLCVAIVIASFFILRWARTSPGYDPYGWLDWGYQTLRGTLNLRGAPSWKPITFLFTVPYSLFGHYSWWLWRVTALSFGIGGPIAGGLLAFRLVRREDEPVWPALIGGLFAGIGIVMIVQYWHYILSSQSDPMLVTFVLLACNQLLSRRYGWAVTFLVAAGLGRPEVWIVLGPVGLWVFITQPRLRRLLVFYVVLMAFLWFGVPVITGAPWDVAQKLAQHSVRALHSNKFLGTISRYGDLTLWPVLVAAGGTFVWALLRRDWRVLGIAAIVIAWMVVEEYFVLSEGFPGVPRYMFEAAAATIVLAGVGVGWLARIVFGSTAGWGLGSAELRPEIRLRARVVAGVLALVLIGFMVPYAKSAWDWEHTDILAERNRTHSIYELGRTIQAAGGAKFVTSCGTPTVDVGTASILAWYTHLNTAQVGYIPKKQIRLGGPVVLFTGLFNGFVMHTYNLTGPAVARCAVLNNAYYLETAGHPDGEFFHLDH